MIHALAGAPPRTPAVETSERLLDLAYDVSLRLRRHARPAIRISAALLVAASLAACDGDPELEVEPPVAVAPLEREVVSGLPTRPGRYPIVERSLQRDQQGVYHFAWRDPARMEGPGTGASVSRLRLAQSSAEMLEIPTEGDPILHLRENSEILLATAGAAVQGTPTSGSRAMTHTYWRPMYGYGGGGPAYYDPPSRVPAGASTVDDARRSATLAAPASRTFGVAHAVSGRAGGTGSGTAASTRAGVAISGGRSGVGASSSSGFSSGGAATAKSGGSS